LGLKIERSKSSRRGQVRTNRTRLGGKRFYQGREDLKRMCHKWKKGVFGEMKKSAVSRS